MKKIRWDSGFELTLREDMVWEDNEEEDSAILLWANSLTETLLIEGNTGGNRRELVFHTIVDKLNPDSVIDDERFDETPPLPVGSVY